jgi:hypothetical protein
MSTDTTDSEIDWTLRVPLESQVGVFLVMLVYGAAALAGTVEYQMSPVVWFAVAAGFLGYAINQLRQP